MATHYIFTMAGNTSEPAHNFSRFFQKRDFLLGVFFVSTSFYLLYTNYSVWHEFKWVEQNSSANSQDPATEWLKFVEEMSRPEKIACHLPNLNPFDENTKKYVKKPKPANCEKDHPLIFTTDQTSNLIQIPNIASLGYQYCCYQKFERDEGRDSKIKLEENCTRITGKKNKIHDEFIMVSCLQKNGSGTSSDKPNWKIVDLFGFVHLKPNVEKRVEARRNKNYVAGASTTTLKSKVNNSAEGHSPQSQQSRSVNVVILGVDGVSHMNFIRVMPLTYEYLTKNLSAHGLFGYTKVGQSTFLNLGPALAGRFYDELKETCWKRKQDPFDNCTFIWKDYRAMGYRTAYGEDAIYMGIFNYMKRGFNKQPTDYYNNALMYHLGKKVGHHGICYGPRLSFQISMDYLKNMAVTMDKTRRYFQFIWTTSMTHDNLNLGMVGDKPLLETLQWFKDQGYLEDTVFILMSDHGINYGSYRNTFQGQLEGRMPFLYFIFPEWFKERYRPAVSSLIRNRNKLTSPLDLYETLKDLADLKRIDNIRDRYKTTMAVKVPRGISLFLPIPPERTCKDAEIPDHFCVCGLRKQVIEVEKNLLVREGANKILANINKMFTKFPQCLPLSLNRVLNAQVLQINNEKDDSDVITNSTDPRLNKHPVTFTIVFETLPSRGIFEATVARESSGNWKVSGEISRTNLYKNQSVCVTDYDLKKFCFCG